MNAKQNARPLSLDPSFSLSYTCSWLLSLLEETWQISKAYACCFKKRFTPAKVIISEVKRLNGDMC